MSSIASELRDKIQKVQALLARPGTPGERQAAMQALSRLRAKLIEVERETRSAEEDGLKEFTVSIPDFYSRFLFALLCRKHGVETYRKPRQRRTTLTFETSASLSHTIGSEYRQLAPMIHAELKVVAHKFMREKGLQ